VLALVAQPVEFGQGLDGPRGADQLPEAAALGNARSAWAQHAPDLVVKLADFLGAGSVFAEEPLSETGGAELVRLGEFGRVPVADDDFHAAAADVDDGEITAGGRHAPEHSQVDEPRLFPSGNHASVDGKLVANPLQDFFAVVGF